MSKDLRPVFAVAALLLCAISQQASASDRHSIGNQAACLLDGEVGVESATTTFENRWPEISPDATAILITPEAILGCLPDEETVMRGNFTVGCAKDVHAQRWH